MGGLFSSPKPPPLPPPPPPPPTIADPAVKARADQLRDSDNQRRGRAASVITGGQGVLGDTAVARPEGEVTKLGG